VVRDGAAPLDHGNGALRRGEIIEVITAGSGGYGPPEERMAAQVHRDLAEARIDVATAARDYGMRP
jgi:N-methylhydantoinase B